MGSRLTAISLSRIAITANNNAPPTPPIMAPSGMKSEEHQHRAIALEVGGLEDLDPGQAGTDTERGPAERA